MSNQTIRFSKKVDSQGRVSIPKEHRKALGILGKEAIVEFEMTVAASLEDDNHTDYYPTDDHTDVSKSTEDD